MRFSFDADNRQVDEELYIGSDRESKGPLVASTHPAWAADASRGDSSAVKTNADNFTGRSRRGIRMSDPSSQRPDV